MKFEQEYKTKATLQQLKKKRREQEIFKIEEREEFLEMMEKMHTTTGFRDKNKFKKASNNYPIMKSRLKKPSQLKTGSLSPVRRQNSRYSSKSGQSSKFSFKGLKGTDKEAQR